MLYLNEGGISPIPTGQLDLTLTSVVFELKFLLYFFVKQTLFNFNKCCILICWQNRIKENEQYLTLTSVVFELPQSQRQRILFSI